MTSVTSAPSLSLPLTAAVFALFAPPAAAQETPPPAREPLPPFRIEQGQFESSLRAFTPDTFVFTGGVTLVWGDVRIEADRLEWERTRQRIVATGNVRLFRGDESLRGTSFVFEGGEGTFTAEKATVVSPPFTIFGERVFTAPDGLRAEQARLSLRPDGGGELQFRTDELAIRTGNRLTMRNATLYAYGKRIVTLRRLSVPLRLEQGGEYVTGEQAPPVVLRISQISGFTFGAGVNSTLLKNLTVSALVEQSARQGTQYAVGLRYSLLGPLPDTQVRRPLPLPFGLSAERGRRRRNRPEPPKLSPLRGALTARTLPPPRDPILDYVDILGTRNILARPTRAGIRDVYAVASFTGKREFGARRQGPLLLSRQPELRVTGRVPLSGQVPVDDNEAGRAALRRPRYYVLGEASAGRVEEIRLSPERSGGVHAVESDRNGLSFGVGLQPLLVANRLLFGGEISYQISRYGGGQSYRFSETTLAVALPRRDSSVGAALIQRGISGSTPFFYDSVDTQSEAQLRGQTRLGRYTLGGVLRFDTNQRKLFDVEIGVGVRGSVLEPRFTYRRLNGQFGVGFVILPFEGL